jgi:hypothetical protein
MLKKMVPLLTLLFLVVSCASLEMNQRKQQETSTPPVITQAYAAPQMRTGGAWKIYLNASDPNGSMQYIVATLVQPGRGGGYPPSFTRIKNGGQQQLSAAIGTLRGNRDVVS